MEVRHDEGVATRIGPEPCAIDREVGSEASAGEGIGQPLSLVKIHIPGADVVAKAEGNMNGCANASIWSARRGRRTWHVQKLFGREPGDPAFDQPWQSGLVRIGKARSCSRWCMNAGSQTLP